jgi:hypothetical protein
MGGLLSEGRERLENVTPGVDLEPIPYNFSRKQNYRGGDAYCTAAAIPLAWTIIARKKESRR